MGFLQDLGGFMSDVNALTEEIDNVKRDVVSSILDSATEVKQTIDDTAAELSQSAGQAKDIVRQSTTLPTQLADDTSSDDQI
jgi:ElaB/YqjD/DUF883 family membrane-anchored ribosome-binding protein